MAVTFVGATADPGAINTTSAFVDVVAPTCEADDILICQAMGKALGNAMSPPDGSWTEIIQADNDTSVTGGDHRYAIFWKLAVLADSGATFRFTKATDDNNLYYAVISAWRGAHTTTPLDDTAVGVTETAGAADAISFPAFDPTGTDSHIIYMGFYGNDLTTMSAAMSSDTNPDCTTRYDYETSADTDATMCCTSGDTTNGDNIAARTWASTSTTDSGSTGVVFALRVAATGTHAHAKVNQAPLHSKLQGLVN